MRVERFDAAPPAELAARVRALVPAGESVAEPVRAIVARVREEGDDAVLALTREHDTRGADPRPLRVGAQELDAAAAALRSDVRCGLDVAMANIAAVAGASLGDDAELLLPQGQRVLVREIPVRRAAIYVPGGRAPYPSTVLMGAVTARVAGVEEIVVCSPPGPDGELNPVVLGACALCHVDEVYRMGGAQAVAALAYGTQTIPRVDVIVGPGNLWVQEAKVQCSADVGIDGFAGPSDVLVLADAGVDATLVALDLLAQAEHGPGSLAVLAGDDPATLDAIAERAVALAGERAHVDFAPLAVVAVPDAPAAIELANAFAPEHLQLVGPRMEARAPEIRCAGTLLVGAASGTAFTDYVAGSNHVLPTGGAARFASGLSPRHFRRRMTEVHVGPAAAQLARAGAPVARAEGFGVHAESMEARQNGAPS
ncbi:MAG TPA: histidinol dehydrogenase [Capillimicrobium sp.]|nr:histidinol dehydrogenase [Capillimicrobium sp.]